MLHQRSQTGSGGIAQQVEAPGNKYPVFPLQRHHICHGTQADHVRVLPQHLLLVTAEGSGQLEGNTHTGEGLVRITAVGTVRIHHSNGFRQDILALMMVGDHQIHT